MKKRTIIGLGTGIIVGAAAFLGTRNMDSAETVYGPPIDFEDDSDIETVYGPPIAFSEEENVVSYDTESYITESWSQRDPDDEVEDVYGPPIDFEDEEQP